MIASTPWKYAWYGVAPVLVHGDPAVLAAEAGGQRDVVAGRHAHLDREQRREAQRAGERAHAIDRLGEVLERHAVLHLDESHVARAREHAVAAVDQVALARRAGHRLRDRRRHRREAAADAAHQPEREVLGDVLVADVSELRRRPGRLVGATVALHLTAARAGHPEELGVVGARRERVDVGEQVVERFDRLVRVEVERRHALDRSRR